MKRKEVLINLVKKCYMNNTVLMIESVPKNPEKSCISECPRFFRKEQLLEINQKFLLKFDENLSSAD